MKRRARQQQLPRPKVARQRPEQILHLAVARHLETRPAPGIFWCHVPNAAKRGLVEGRIFKQVGTKAGTPDLLLVKSGKLCALELKSERGRLSKAQKQCHDELRQAGVVVAVAHDVTTAVAWLEKLGFLRGEMQ